MFFSVPAADLAHFPLLRCPRTVEPGRQVLALHAVVLVAEVPQDDWLGTQEVVERRRVQLLICSSETPASVFKAVESKMAAWGVVWTAEAISSSWTRFDSLSLGCLPTRSASPQRLQMCLLIFQSLSNLF